jgi:hypothetical protein
VQIGDVVIGYDGQGRYLVKAKTTRQITGPHTSSKDNLPAHIIGVGKDVFVVDRSKTIHTSDEARKIRFQPIEGNWHIQPRGQDKPVSDLMAGFDHQYVQKDDE